LLLLVTNNRTNIAFFSETESFTTPFDGENAKITPKVFDK